MPARRRQTVGKNHVALGRQIFPVGPRQEHQGNEMAGDKITEMVQRLRKVLFRCLLCRGDVIVPHIGAEPAHKHSQRHKQIR